MQICRDLGFYTLLKKYKFKKSLDNPAEANKSKLLWQENPASESFWGCR
jgi:hypothetical protein